MNINSIGTPHLLLVLIISGLIVSYIFRAKPWVTFVWIPATLTLLYEAFSLARRLVVMESLRGPDAGWAGIAISFLLPTLGVCIFGLFLSYLCRPRKSAWGRAFICMPAIILSFMALALWIRHDETNVQFQLSDVAGMPLSGVPVQISHYQGGIGTDAKLCFSDSTGSFNFKFGRNETAEFDIKPISKPSQKTSSAPTYWTVNIGPLEGSPNKLKVRHSWQRPVGSDGVLDESFIEIIPFEREIRLPLTLPPHESLDPGPRRNRIRAAFATFQHDTPQGLDYSYVCRNVESIEFIPELIDTYRNKEQQRGSVIEGLCSIAETLSDLNTACGGIQRHWEISRSPRRQSFRDEIAQLCIWAGISYDARSDDEELIEQVKTVIAAHAKLLIDFSLEEMHQDKKTLKLLSELRRLARPTLPGLVRGLIEKPPENMQSALSWSDIFYLMGANESELVSLRMSGNPLLEAAAGDARPNK